MDRPGSSPQRLREVARVFLKLGLIGFGGPAAHIALMHREVVERRGWMDEQRFVDLFAVSNLLPGPTSTELGIFLGYERAGWPGLLAAGVLFIAPAMLMVLALAWTYVRFGSVPAIGWILYGVTATVIGIVADALWRIGRTAIRGVGWLLLAVGALVLYLAGVPVLVILFGGALLAMLAVNRTKLRLPGTGVGGMVALLGAVPRTVGGAAPLAPATVGLGPIFLEFLKLGAVVYGGGYVLLAFLRTDVVRHLHWITDHQLLDAVAVGQATPGPVFTTAAFVGYLVHGWQGALVATAGIFLPSFVLVAGAYRVLPRLKGSPWASAFLAGAAATALGLMAGVTYQLARVALVDAVTVGLAVVSFVVLRRYAWGSPWVILGGGAIGLLAKALTR
jgi:chromate transporter